MRGVCFEVMRLFSAFALVAGSLSICAEALQLHKRTDGPPRVVGMPMERKSVPDPILRDRIRRRGTVKSSLQNKVCSDLPSLRWFLTFVGNAIFRQLHHRHTCAGCQITHRYGEQ